MPKNRLTEVLDLFEGLRAIIEKNNLIQNTL